MAVLIVMAAAACGDADAGAPPGAAATPDTTPTDSAGIPIVVNHRPAWPEGGGWMIDPDPLLEIGPTDDDPRLNLYGVEYAVLLEDGQVALPNRGSHEIVSNHRGGGFEAMVAGQGRGSPGRSARPGTSSAPMACIWAPWRCRSASS